MNILLIGNYIHFHQQSQQHFAELMRDMLLKSGFSVRLLHPPSILGNLRPSERGIGKWFGYIDQYVLFFHKLQRELDWADVVHICVTSHAIYVPWLNGKPHVVTCHDMLSIRSALGEIPESPTRWSGRIYQQLILRGLERAQHVVCVSRQTQRELLQIAGLPPNRTSVVHNALNFTYSPMLREEAAPYLRSLDLVGEKSFFLHVGGNQWYKNRSGAVHIFSKIIENPLYKTHILVMIGKPWTIELRQLVQALGLQTKVLEIVNVSNTELQALYSQAEALIFPSLAEGFGWPIVEAQACGCPVVTSNRPPMTEVGGQAAAIYIDPENISAATQAILEGLREKKRLIEAGIVNSKRYSGQAFLNGYISAYREAIALSTGSG